MSVLDVLAVLLVVLAAVNTASTAVLVIAAMRHHWPALEERAAVAIVLAIIAIGAAVLGLARLHLLNVAPETSLGILAVGLVLVSAPSIVWLLAFLSGSFEESEGVTAARAADELADHPYTGEGDH